MLPAEFLCSTLLCHSPVLFQHCSSQPHPLILLPRRRTVLYILSKHFIFHINIYSLSTLASSSYPSPKEKDGTLLLPQTFYLPSKLTSLINSYTTSLTFSASTLKIKTLDLKSPMGGFRGLLLKRGLGRPPTPYEIRLPSRSIHKYVLQNNPVVPVSN